MDCDDAWRFIESILAILAQNEITETCHLNNLSKEDLKFGENCPGGRVGFVKTALKKFKEELKKPEADTSGEGLDRAGACSGCLAQCLYCICLWPRRRWP